MQRSYVKNLQFFILGMTVDTTAVAVGREIKFQSAVEIQDWNIDNVTI